MVSGLPFGSLRIIIMTLAVLAQITLFLYIRHRIRSSRRSDRFKSGAVFLVGAAIVLLFSNSLSFLPGCLEETAKVRARYGTFATQGNHEHWYGGLSELQTIFRNSGIPLLHNTHQVIQNHLHSGAIVRSA